MESMLIGTFKMDLESNNAEVPATPENFIKGEVAVYTTAVGNRFQLKNLANGKIRLFTAHKYVMRGLNLDETWDGKTAYKDFNTLYEVDEYIRKTNIGVNKRRRRI